MPRSTDGRWTKQCEVCGKDYQQRKPGQLTCSTNCRAKLPHNTGGVRPKIGLSPIECPTCGVMFTPVREIQVACSRACYRQTPNWQDSQRRQDARPERRARQNERRRLPDADEARRDAIREYNFRYNLKSKYKLTAEEHDAMFIRQNGVCAICGRAADPNGVRSASRLHIDHDHVTGRTRELLCNTCNQGLGYLKDDPALLRAAAAYIEKHRRQEDANLG